MGRLLGYLDDRNLAASTLVIFASDHGTELFDHGINNDKHNFLDASLRVPLIMRLPGVRQRDVTMSPCHHAIVPPCHHAIMPSCHHVTMKKSAVLSIFSGGCFLDFASREVSPHVHPMGVHRTCGARPPAKGESTAIHPLMNGPRGSPLWFPRACAVECGVDTRCDGPLLFTTLNRRVKGGTLTQMGRMLPHLRTDRCSLRG